jgi:putative ABC transport system permease protein
VSRYLSVLILRIRSLFYKQTVERELEKELQLHVDELTAEYLAQGLTAEDAVHAAKRTMGGVTQIAEQCRDYRRTAFRDRAVQDLKYSIRVLRANPMFTFIGIASLALGIGANTLMFSIVHSILLRPLPYNEPSQLLWITQISARMPMGFVLPPEFANWRQDSHAFSGMSAWNDDQFTLTGTREPQHIAAATVNAGFFRTLGVAPALGRAFTTSEDGSNPEHLVILSDALWKSQFSADRKILGRTIVLNSLGYTVIGVLPPEFRFPDESQPELYLPGGFSGPAQWNAPRMSLLRIAGRLRAGVTAAQAERELKTINHRHRAEIPTTYRRTFEGRVFQMLPLQQKLVGDLRPALLVLWGAVCLLLLLTCSNLAALQLARAFARSGEFAIRLALGGDRKRLVQLLLTENLLLAGIGASLGVAGAYALLPAVRTLNALHLASPADLSIDPVVLLAALGLTIGSAFLFGLGPALATSMLTPNEAMKSGAKSIAGGSWSDRARSALVSVQIAVALILVLAAGLLLKSAAKILSNPLGMQPAQLLTATFRVDPQRYPNEEKTAALGEQILEKLEHIPGVESAGLTNALPFGHYSLGAAVVFEGRPTPPPGARPLVPIVAITPDYLRTLQAPILAGRGIERLDRHGSAPVAVVNHTFVLHFFPDSDPIGRRFRLGADGAPWTEIVGIVADTRHRGQDADPEAEIFVPFVQAPGNALGLAIRSALPMEALAPAIRSQFRTVDPNMPIFNIATMEQRISSTLEPRRIELLLICGFSLLAFFLAVTGVYGVINYAVTRRTREFGVKLALGAKPSHIATDVLRRGLLLAAGGILPGLALSYFAARYLSSLLYKVKPEDLQAYIGAGILLLAAIIAACLIPARRASRTDPLNALRWE